MSKQTSILKIKSNILFFALDRAIKETDKEFKLLQKLARTGDKLLFNQLVAKGVILDFKKGHNLVASEGREVFSARLTGDDTYTGEITHGALGDGDDPNFSTSDTKLVNEVYRKPPSDASYDGTTAYIDFFFSSSEVDDGEYSEWGTFIDGDSDADSGQAFSLYETGGWQKNGSMFVSSQYNINQDNG